jgi:O-antigen chain-terminating methyltransferase
VKKNFYRAFEEKYRGSRELITGRLQFYLPFIEPLVREFGRVPAIDLGCGRGEWLEVMLAAGFDARGIDLDECMLQACVDLGLPAEKGEAIAHLRGLPSKSQAIVSAFHVVEHISFDALQELVSEAKRVLLPGGLLILETPNPENIMVATCSFYLDPTHQRPIPPLLLSFVAEHAGFERVKVIRLQESKELASKPDLLLEDVLGGVSPDYSVVAQKNGKKSTMSALEPVFSQDYGLTLSGLSSSYDAHMRGKLGEEKLNFLKEQLEAEKNRANNLATERLQLAERVTALESERSTLSSDNASLATRHQLLATECEALSARLSTLVAERDALQHQLDEIHQANHRHFQLAESLKQELAAKEQAWDSERSTLDTRLSTLVSENTSLATSNSLLVTEREALQQQVSAKDEALAAIRETLTAERLTFEAQRSLLASEKSALDARLSTLVSEHDALHQANHGHWQLSENLKQELAAKEQAWSHERSTLDSRHSTLLAERQALSTSYSLLATERDALLASTCWRITAPIRWVRGGVRIPWPAPNEPLDDFFLKHAALYIRRRPHLKERALQFLLRNPKWHARVLPVLQDIKASKPSPQASQPIPQPVQLLQPAPQPAPLLELFTPQELPAPIPEPAAAPVESIVDLSSLTPHARRIYSDLKKAIEMKKGEVSA